MRIRELRDEVRALGANDRHEGRLLRSWAQATPLDVEVAPGSSLAKYPKAVIAALPELETKLAGIARVRERHDGADGSARLLVELVDGQTVETVLLLKDGICVSTQVGCAVGCRFCMTGQTGLSRQLGSAEIVAQVVLGRRMQKVQKVVFMGMGEPAHNLDSVLEAIELLGVEGGIGHKNLVFSTVGDPRVFERLPLAKVKPALALSLHTTRADLRAELLPRAPRMTPEELVGQADAYARATHHPIQYQWTLLDGVNDTDEEMERAAELLRGRYGVLNLIPYNANDGLPYRRPEWARAREIAQRLSARGILTKLRNSVGQDVDAGCGQLRARTEKRVELRRKEAVESRGPVAAQRTEPGIR